MPDTNIALIERLHKKDGDLEVYSLNDGSVHIVMRDCPKCRAIELSSQEIDILAKALLDAANSGSEQPT